MTPRVTVPLIEAAGAFVRAPSMLAVCAERLASAAAVWLSELADIIEARAEADDPHEYVEELTDGETT